MEKGTPATEPDLVPRALPRARVLLVGLVGLAAGLILAVVGSGETLVRWLLAPLSLASVGVLLGLLWTVRRERRIVHTPVPRRVAPPQPHQLPKAPPAPGQLELGPDPWEASLPSHLDDAEGELVEFPPGPPLSEESSEAGSPALYVSHDGARLLRPRDHELERARRAVAGMVADLAPPPGAFDAVCERLIGVGTSMAQQLAGLGRETTDFEKVFGFDLFDRLTETRVTEAGLGVMTWVRWLHAALQEDDARDDTEFFSPIAVAMASRYGGTSERWQAVISEPLRQVELGGVVEQIALAVKASERDHSAPPDPEEVRKLLEAPQWM